MKVSVALGALAHAYSLAGYLHRGGQLSRLYTHYPLPFIDKELRPYTRTFPWIQAVSTLLSRAGMSRLAGYLAWPAIEIFDKWVARSMEPCDVFVAMSGLGLYARRAAKKLGAFTGCDQVLPISGV